MGLFDRICEARRAVRMVAMRHWRERAAERQKHSDDLQRGGAGAADSPQRQMKMRLRATALDRAQDLRRRGALPIGIERRMGPTLDFSPFAPSAMARAAGRPVARIVEQVGAGLLPRGIATGFLVTPTLLLTNHHVFPSRADAAGTGANFLFEKTERGVETGVLFEMDPDRFYLSDRRLDYCVVAVKPTSLDGRALAELGVISLIEATPKILIGERVNIIQHPEGGEKAYAFTQNRLLDILEEGFLHYETDTLEGSSGAPAFSERWELVALHRASIPRMNANGEPLNRQGDVWREEQGDEAVDWVANEGTRVSAIVKHLSNAEPATPAERAILRDLIGSTVDPLDEIEESISRDQAARPVSPGAVGAPASSSGTPFNQFVFSGPVVINVQAPVAPQPHSGTLSEQQLTAAPPIRAPEKVIRFDPDYDSRPGYDPKFLAGTPARPKLVVPPPSVASRRLRDILKDEDGAPLVLAYHHFSLVMNKKRRMAQWSAANVDYDPQVKSSRNRKEFGDDKWIPDPRIPAAAQIFDAEFYKPATNIDRGHLVRREDNAWGETEEAVEFANSDTFHWTNCTPQHEAFNQSDPGRYDRTYRGMNGLWGALENHIQASRKGAETRLILFAGPVLDDLNDPSEDFGRGTVQYPLRFWKVVVVAEPKESAGRRTRGNNTELKAFAFLLDQTPVVDAFGIERFDPGKFGKWQVSLRYLTDLTDVVFDQRLHEADQGKDLPDLLPLTTLADLRGL